MKNGRWLGCLLAGAWCCCEPGWGSLLTCLGYGFATATMLPLVQGWSAGVDGRLMRFFSTAALPLLWVGAATGWIMVGGSTCASTLLGWKELCLLFAGKCFFVMLLWGSLFPLIRLFKGVYSLYFLFCKLVLLWFVQGSLFPLHGFVCPFCIAGFQLVLQVCLALFDLYNTYIWSKKIEIWSRKAKTGLIAATHKTDPKTFTSKSKLWSKQVLDPSCK